MPISIYLSVSLSLSIYLLSIYLSIYLSIHLYLYLYLSIYIFGCLCICLCLCLYLHLYIHVHIIPITDKITNEPPQTASLRRGTSWAPLRRARPTWKRVTKRRPSPKIEQHRLKVPCAPKWFDFEFPVIKMTKLWVETRSGRFLPEQIELTHSGSLVAAEHLEPDFFFRCAYSPRRQLDEYR